MWVPSIRSLIFGRSLPSDESKKQLYLQKVINNFEFGTNYSEFEVINTIRTAHVVNVKLFKDALLEYGYLEEDLYFKDCFRRIK